jgi:hypothetical protein
MSLLSRPPERPCVPAPAITPGSGYPVDVANFSPHLCLLLRPTRLQLGLIAQYELIAF